MVFSSSVFLLLFLPIVFVVGFCIKKSIVLSNIWLLLASLIFYAWGEPYFICIMLVSIFLNWIVGIGLSVNNDSMRKIILVVGVIGDISILGYYKYAGFISESINYIVGQELVPNPCVPLPIGISFFTFQAISYIVDVYRKDTEASKNPINVALYISFFPQLIAGPIVKYRDINEQIKSRNINYVSISDGFKRYIYGLGKKVLIANTLGLCIDTIYSYDISQIDCKTAWIGAIAYTFQIYYDFSGYSDMAIGLGKMFGFDIKENFNYPYLSKSITEFWRRWHISLGSWFREYLYIPLGGNRKGQARTYLNLIIVFLLTGLWHGADFSFIIWGLWHGLFTIIERVGFSKVLSKNKYISGIYTFLVVTIGWVLFRADNTIIGISYLSRMLPWAKAGTIIETWKYVDSRTIFSFVCAVLGMGLFKSICPKNLKEKWSGSITEAIYCIVVLIWCLSCVASDTYNPFIYFQF